MTGADKSMVTMGFVEVPSGNFVDMDDPDPSTILLSDVAHKLAQTNRYGGSTEYPYSVAQHAVFVSERLRRQGYSPNVQLLGLHHDDAEAFLGDIPRPWKAKLGSIYKEMTLAFDMAIEEALELPYMHLEEHRIIKQADNFALLVEARKMLPSGGHRWDYLKDFDLPKRIIIPDYFRGEIYWEDARDTYLRRHEDLTG